MSHGKNLRRYRIGDCGNIYSVTTCTENRARHFNNFQLARNVIAALRHQDESSITNTLAFVLMPDHLHWLFELNKSNLSSVMHSIKSFTSHLHGSRLWQEGYYENRIRDEKSVIEQSRYIVANPLRAKLVEHIGMYPHWDAVWLNGKI